MKKKRGLRRYFRNLGSCFFVESLDFSGGNQSWFDLYHIHVDGTGLGSKSWRSRKQHLDAFTGARFDHHLGHGIGLFPHEAPHLNSHWDDVFEVGDVFTCEPGLYSNELRGGIRLENDYLVTETGVELLSDFPLELA